MEALLSGPVRRAVVHPRVRTLWWPTFAIDRRMSQAYRLAESCGYESEHAEQVMRLSLALFEQLRPLHELHDRRRRWLAAAALLHDIGRCDGSRGHHKRSLQIIRASPMLDWTRRERLVVGSIARYHRRALPDPQRHDHFASLAENDRRCVRWLAGILRLADGLDRTHRSTVRDVRCDWRGEHLIIRCGVDRPGASEQIGGERKADLLSRTLRRNVRVQWRVD